MYVNVTDRILGLRSEAYDSGTWSWVVRLPCKSKVEQLIDNKPGYINLYMSTLNRFTMLELDCKLCEDK
jgi:hypothetical protein